MTMLPQQHASNRPPIQKSGECAESNFKDIAFHS
jgi:hypothetical protein